MMLLQFPQWKSLSILWIVICAFVSPIHANLHSHVGVEQETHIARRWTHRLVSPLPLQKPGTGNTSLPLDIFQVHKPIKKDPTGGCSGKILLMQHVFANSYGSPFVGNYTPPSCTFTHVSIEFKATAAGRQFDRLALMYLGDIEVWRPSTAEPTASGIVFTYEKDMTAYLPLWKKPQTVIFDLGNIVNNVYTAPINTTMYAKFWTEKSTPLIADMILPISKKLGASGKASAFNTAEGNTSVIQTIPVNTQRAVVSISACGQSTEEFWWSNVLSNDTATFNDTAGELYGYSPFREVQIYIDGSLAGVVWPFPIIFTGGVAPGLWRPIVGIDAYDLREPEIDITPFVPLLTDGKPHTFEIKVAGIDTKNGNSTLTSPVGGWWILTGKIFIYASKSTSNPQITVPFYKDHTPPTSSGTLTLSTTSSLTQSPLSITNTTITNSSLAYSALASRNLQISHPIAGSYSQTLSFSSKGIFTNKGLTQQNDQIANGSSFSSAFQHTTSFSYPITSIQTITYLSFPKTDEVKIDASLKFGLHINSDARIGDPISLFTLVTGPMRLDTTQEGVANFSNQRNGSYNSGSMKQSFVERSGGSVYVRDVEARNLTIVRDREVETLDSRVGLMVQDYK
ncbi:hypothetical protein EJ08DRAFT_609892 [Tothia fuscella]|uniref:Peptide N-acetyl-beta-D-glucosaminyl asparaginase amidase A N-terminal domain-containing protein n=1 Tax=Tothia fuscella TaxID=1048955 RepID=A0A9P4TZY3_9PEZI|nr:hypothetical protein EJ08DRAFT_609892 [Tothia fuscella]